MQKNEILEINVQGEECLVNILRSASYQEWYAEQQKRNQEQTKSHLSIEGEGSLLHMTRDVLLRSTFEIVMKEVSARIVSMLMHRRNNVKADIFACPNLPGYVQTALSKKMTDPDWATYYVYFYEMSEHLKEGKNMVDLTDFLNPEKSRLVHSVYSTIYDILPQVYILNNAPIYGALRVHTNKQGYAYVSNRYGEVVTVDQLLSRLFQKEYLAAFLDVSSEQNPLPRSFALAYREIQAILQEVPVMEIDFTKDCATLAEQLKKDHSDIILNTNIIVEGEKQ
jgi:hypothetical protein